MRRFALSCFAIVGLFGCAMTPQSAQAFGWDRGDGIHDPYFYRPGHRGYYPYYNSGQWRSARYLRWKMRAARQKFRYPQYNPAWGHPVDGYRHREFHAQDGYRHYLGDW
jgi:hypothetical protein